MDVYDDEVDICLNCGSNHFEGNERDWERVCLQCGTTSCFEWFNPIKIAPDYFYKHENYFQNTIIQGAIGKGAMILHIEDHLMLMFHKSLCLFHRCKSQLQRDNYPSYQYALLQLCAYLGVDVLPFVRLPKMKKTMAAIVSDWKWIDPTTND